MAKAAWVQVVKADEITLRSVLAPQRDEVSYAGGKQVRVVRVRRYLSNPRITEVLKELPYGTIYDRKELPLASSKWDVLEANRARYKELGVDLDKVCRKGRRCYPFGPTAFFLLGDVRTRKNWGGENFFIEKEYEAWLRGFNDHESSPEIKVKQLTPKLDHQTGEPVIDRATGRPEWNETMIERHVAMRDYRELLPLLRDRYSPNNRAAERLRHNARDVRTSIDAKLQVLLTRIVEDELRAGKLKYGAAVVLEPRSGDLLASVSYPYPSDDDDNDTGGEARRDAARGSPRLQDRARFGREAPGSTFKIVTAMAAARAVQAEADTFGWGFSCVPVEEKRNGEIVRGNGTRVRGKVFMDHEGAGPHREVKFERAFFESCNAYFVQLGEEVAGAEALYETAQLFGIKASAPPGLKDEPPPQDFVRRLYVLLPQASIGQGEVRTNVFEMAKVAATVANRGTMPYGQWVTGESNLRKNPPVTGVVTPAAAEAIANAMLKVTTDENGTASKAFAGSPVQVAGKTGTAQDGVTVGGKYVRLDPHSWFVGFAPFDGPNRVAFAVIAENGGGGSGIAARISRRLVEAAGECGLYSGPPGNR